jgi:hypothetical protein
VYYCGTGNPLGRVSRGTNRTVGQKIYDHTAGRAGIAYSGTSFATAPEQDPTRYQPAAPTRGVANPDSAADCDHEPE